MDFDHAVNRRTSVRSFKSRKPDWRSVLEAVHAATKGPFAGNFNNIKFVIVEDPEMIDKLSKFTNQSWIGDAPTLVIVCSDDTHLENIYGERGRIYSRQQAGAAINTFLLKIADLGLASCWVGAYTDELIKQALSIPAHIQIEAILPVGHEKGKEHKKRKLDLEHAIYWGEWMETRRPPKFFREPPEKDYK